MDLLESVKSESAAFDNAVRAEWVGRLDETTRERIRTIARKERFELYRDVDRKIKNEYVETLRRANEKLVVVHVKGMGPMRRATELVDLDLTLKDAVSTVLIETGFVSA